MKLKNLVTATAAALGIGASASASAISFGLDFKGYVTMLNGTGAGLQNSSYAAEPKFAGFRTPVQGSMVLNVGLTGMSGTATFNPFLFFGIVASGRDINFVPVDTTLNIPGSTLLLGNLLFDYGSYTGIPVSIVLDMGNLTTALMESSPGDVLRGVMTAESDNTVFRSGKQTFTLPMGPVVVATTSWNTTMADTDNDGQPGPITFGTNPSGVLPLLIDTTIDSTNGDVGIGGVPMPIGAFIGFNPNFDFTEVTVTCVGLLTDCDLPAPLPIPLSPQPLGGLLGTLGGLLP